MTIGIVIAVLVGGGDEADSPSSSGDDVEATDDPDAADGDGPTGEDSNADGEGSDADGEGADGEGADGGTGADGEGADGGTGADGGSGADGGDGSGSDNGSSGGNGDGSSDGDPAGGDTGSNGPGSDSNAGGGTDPGSGGNQPPGSSSGVGFGDGTYIVGEDIEPGLYRSSTTGACYWARLSGLAGDLDEITTNGLDSPEIVAVLPGDEGFETQECGEWVPVSSTVPNTPATSFGDGTHLVGEHIEPGTYTADGDDEFCYWARLSDFEHVFDGIIANGMGPRTVEIRADDVGFSTFGCGRYTKS